MFSFLKKLFKGFDPDLTDSEDNVSPNATEAGGIDFDALWAAVVGKLANDVKTTITTPKGRGYIVIASGVNKGKLSYVCGYTLRSKIASVGVETYHGDEARTAIQEMIDKAPKKFILKDVEAKQGVKNKSKWVWGVGTSNEIPQDDLVSWYAETIIEIYKYFEAQAPIELTGVSDSEDVSGKTVVSDAKVGDYVVVRYKDNSVTVSKNGILCDNTKGTLREIAGSLGFEYDDVKWNTQQLGAKLIQFIKENGGKPAVAQNEHNKIAEEAAKAVAEAKAAAEMAMAEAKAAAEKAKADAAAAQKAAEAELKKLKEEAAKAKAMAEKEAAAARAEAEAAIKAAAEEAKKTKAAPKASKSSNLEGALPGVFTLQDGKKIRFAQGNLQFHPKNYEFRFAKEQYETLGKEANLKCAPNLDGWIDIFGWGTSGYMGCQPTEDDLNEKDYGPASGDLTGENANYDWGVYNPITNGGNKEGLWRTPTPEEMGYILSGRPNAAKLKLKCMVCGVEGFIIMPDDFWSNRLRFPIEISSNDPKDNQFDKDQWELLESIGVVFIPRSYYKCFSVSKSWVEYTSSSFLTTDRQRYVYDRSVLNTTDCYYKMPVRLVKDVK